jgi:hypothetical protein
MNASLKKLRWQEGLRVGSRRVMRHFLPAFGALLEEMDHFDKKRPCRVALRVVIFS